MSTRKSLPQRLKNLPLALSSLHQSKIVTTEEEIEAYYIIKGLLARVVQIDDVVHRDTESYFGILYQNNNRKPICRINLDKRKSKL